MVLIDRLVNRLFLDLALLEVLTTWFYIFQYSLIQEKESITFIFPFTFTAIKLRQTRFAFSLFVSFHTVILKKCFYDSVALYAATLGFRLGMHVVIFMQ